MGNRTPYVCLIVMLIGFMHFVDAQKSISGRVADGITGEFLKGVLIGTNNSALTVTDELGNFHLSISIEEVMILGFSYHGYETRYLSIKDLKGDSVNVQLYPLAVEMDEVTVVHSTDSRFLRDTRTGIVELSTTQSQYLPQFLGQTDLFKTLELMPGYRTGGEGDAAIYIRGGSFDQNLILLDGAPVYNPSHLLGFYSVFNADIVNRVELIKSGIPATYGNRLSSVILCSSETEIPESFTGGLGAGVLSTNADFHLPLLENKLSVYVGGRRTHINMILSLMDEFDLIQSRSVEFESGYDFYDINAGIIFEPTSNHRFDLRYYKGRDVFNMFTPSILLDADMGWGNEVVSLEWKHNISGSLRALHTFYYSDYDFEMELRNPAYDLLLRSGVTAFGQKSELSYFLNQIRLTGGVENKFQRFTPNSSRAGSSDFVFDFGEVDRHRLGEYSVFLSMDVQLSYRWMLTSGIRMNRAVHYGPYRSFQYDSEAFISDTTFYSRGETAARFTRPDLMVSLRYMLNENSSLKFSANKNHQFTHMVNATTVSFPVDFWIGSGADIPVQNGWQIAGGWYHSDGDGIFRYSAEVYYKESQNQSEFDNFFMQSVDNTPLVESLVYGKGRSWGIEFLTSKNIGKWRGWIGYTFSKSIISIPEIENGRWFPASYDRPHDISLVASYNRNERWKFGGNFVYSTGRPFTPSVGRYFFENNVVSIYGARNSDRFPDYHRLDLSATRVLKDTGKRYSALVFSVYNAYSRSNPFFIFPKATGDLSEYHLEVEPYEVSIFPILPSISWQYRF